jgi:hypothetical protein
MKSADLRYHKMKLRLLTLTKAEVQTIVDNIDLVLFDDCNYRDGKFCPLAIALGAHTLPNPSQELVEKYIAEWFYPVNILHGTPGEFYHGTEAERRRDLLSLCEEILK